MARKKRGDEKATDLFHRWPEEIVLIGHDTEDRWEHPLYDPRVHDDADALLAASIAEHGSVHTPITVIEDGKNEDGSPRVVCKVGRGRVKAARALNETRVAMDLPREFRVPCQYDRKGSEKAMLAHLISENEQRRNDGLERKIQKLERFLQAGGTEREAAIHFRRTESTIKNWVKLMGAVRQWQKVVYTGGGSMVDVLRILSDGDGGLLPLAEQTKLFRAYEQRKLSSQQEADTETQGTEKPAEPEKPKKLTGKLNPGRPKGPGRKTVDKVLVAAESSEVELHPEFVRALKWTAGKIDAAEAGLEAVLAKKTSDGKTVDKPKGKPGRPKIALPQQTLDAVANVLDHDGMTIREVLKALPNDVGVDDSKSLSKYLARLIEQGIIDHRGERRGKKYFLAQND